MCLACFHIFLDFIAGPQKSDDPLHVSGYNLYIMMEQKKNYKKARLIQLPQHSQARKGKK